jgi:hypothetical protein
VREVRRAVERIDKPSFVVVTAMNAGLFRNDRRPRSRGGNSLDDELLAAAVEFRNEIGPP